MWLSCETQFKDLGKEPERHVVTQKAAVDLCWDTVWRGDKGDCTITYKNHILLLKHLFSQHKEKTSHYLGFYMFNAWTFLGG